MKPKMKPKILPVAYLSATLMLMFVVHRWLPVAQLVGSPANYAGIVLLVAGIVIAGVSAGAFVTAGTPLLPFSKSTTVVTTGLNRYTRNPMYLGMVVALSGVGIFLGSLSGFVPIPVFVWIIDRRFIRLEEEFMEELFGVEYLRYKQQVRRWV